MNNLLLKLDKKGWEMEYIYLIIIIFVILGFFNKKVSQEELIEKVDELNRGILNPNNAPDSFSIEQMNNMAMLCLKLGSYENELKNSNINNSRLKEIKKRINQIEKEAKAI